MEVGSWKIFLFSLQSFMPKIKSSVTESLFSHLDRIPEKEEAFEILRGSFRAVASFYGFEKISYSALDNAHFYQPLLKAGLMAEHQPIILKSADIPDMIMRCSASLSALRAYVCHKMHDFPQPVKLFSEAEHFFTSSRADLPIARRDEVALVMTGEKGPITEAQIIQVIWKSLIDMGVPADRVNLVINAIGCAQCAQRFRSSLTSHLRNKVAGLCKNCKRNFKTAPTRLLACEEEKCGIAISRAPQILDYLCEDCKKHLRGFLEFLDEMGMSYHIDARRFRSGFWADTILFEFAYNPHVVAQSAEYEHMESGAGKMQTTASHPLLSPLTISKRGVILAEGGRMTRAAELMGVKGLEAVAGVILLDAVEQAVFPPRTLKSRPDVYLAQLGEIARRRSLRVLEILRLANITVKESLGRDAIKSQLKLAEKFGAPIALILGQKEVIDQTIIVREIDSGIQETVPQEKLVDFLKRRLKT